jgi:hypothetical protein
MSDEEHSKLPEVLSAACRCGCAVERSSQFDSMLGRTSSAPFVSFVFSAGDENTQNIQKKNTTQLSYYRRQNRSDETNNTARRVLPRPHKKMQNTHTHAPHKTQPYLTKHLSSGSKLIAVFVLVPFDR